MSALPWFKVYAAETLSDENFQGWDVSERGAWFTLLCVAWREGSIPGDLTTLAKLLHCDSSTMRQLWSAIGSRFVPHPDYPGRLTSPRLEMEREKAKLLAAKKADAGRSGAELRWAREKAARGKAMALPPAANGSEMAADSDPDPAEGRVGEASLQGPAADKLADLRTALAERFRLQRVGIGKDRPRVEAVFGRWLGVLGLKATVDECERLARERNAIPGHLSWWCGWLETVSDAELAAAAARQRGGVQ